jgi:hypothetical protein
MRMKRPQDIASCGPPGSNKLLKKSRLPVDEIYFEEPEKVKPKSLFLGAEQCRCCFDDTR